VSADIEEEHPEGEPEGEAPAEGYADPPMTIWEHLAELRKRLVYSVVALLASTFGAFAFKERILEYISAPFCASWVEASIPGKCELNFGKPQSSFTSYFALSLLTGLVVSAPIIFYQLWSFVAPGLYAREKKFVVPFVLSSSALMVGGAYFCLHVALPLAFNYLLGLSGQLPGGHLVVAPRIEMEFYIDFVSQMMLGFGIVFELPLLILFLSLVGVVNYLQLIHYARYFIVLAVVVAAVLTPPDITSQLVMAVPMVALYGASIALAYFFGKAPTEAQRRWYKEQREKKKEGGKDAATA
jgi:sec-independent protein translocase protein TatC